MAYLVVCNCLDYIANFVYPSAPFQLPAVHAVFANGLPIHQLSIEIHNMVLIHIGLALYFCESKAYSVSENSCPTIFEIS